MDIIAEQDISNLGFQSYDFSSFGTLSTPLDKLDSSRLVYQVWEELFRRTNDLDKKGILMDAIENIDPIDRNSVKTVQEAKRIYYMMSFVVVTIAKDNGGANISNFLEGMMNSTLQLAEFKFHNYYYTSVIYNWDLIDIHGPISLENIRINRTLSGTKEEEMFYKIHVVMEGESYDVIKTILLLKDAIKEDNHEKIIILLNSMENWIFEMKETVLKLKDIDLGVMKKVLTGHELANFNIECSPLVIFIDTLFGQNDRKANDREIDMVLNEKHSLFKGICSTIGLHTYIESNKYYDYEMKNGYDNCLKAWASFHMNYPDFKD